MDYKYMITLENSEQLISTNSSFNMHLETILKQCQNLNHCILLKHSSIDKIKLNLIKERTYHSYLDGNLIFFNNKIIYKNLINISTLNKIISLNTHIKSIVAIDKNNKLRKIIIQNFNSFSEVKYCLEIELQLPDEIKKQIYELNIDIIKNQKNDYFIIRNKCSKKTNISNYIDNDFNPLKLLQINFKEKDNLIKVYIENNNISLQRIGKTYGQQVCLFLESFFNISVATNRKNIKILDCTLRDGGHTNNSNFGKNNILKIVDELNTSKVDIIELGFLEDCEYNPDIAKFNTVEDAENLLKNLVTTYSEFSLLMQVDKFNIDKLSKANGQIKIIRVSFHQDLINKAIKYIKLIKKLGYICYVNPINYSGYSNEDILVLFKELANIKYDSFSFVDTFGTCTNTEFINKLNLTKLLLPEKTNICLHLHDNLYSSFSTSQLLINNIEENQTVVIDSSVMGMGRAPGNLRTELILSYLNYNFKTHYNLEPIYELMESLIKKFSNSYDWKNNFIYSIGALNKIHRSYSQYLIENGFETDKAERIIKNITPEKKNRYDQKYIEKISKEVDYYVS